MNLIDAPLNRKQYIIALLIWLCFSTFFFFVWLLLSRRVSRRVTRWFGNFCTVIYLFIVMRRRIRWIWRDSTDHSPTLALVWLIIATPWLRWVALWLFAWIDKDGPSDPLTLSTIQYYLWIDKSSSKEKEKKATNEDTPDQETKQEDTA